MYRSSKPPENSLLKNKMRSDGAAGDETFRKMSQSEAPKGRLGMYGVRLCTLENLYDVARARNVVGDVESEMRYSR